MDKIDFDSSRNALTSTARGNVFVETALLMSLISLASLAAISYAGKAVSDEFRAAGQSMTGPGPQAAGAVGNMPFAPPPGFGVGSAGGDSKVSRSS